MIKYIDLKNKIKNQFVTNNITDFFDIEIIISKVLSVDISYLINRPNISTRQEKRINRAVKKRLKGIPVDIIFKEKNFYGLDFFVNKNVLTPRKETELVVEECIKNLKNSENVEVLDMCTGSGIIAITLKKILPNINVTAVDISKKAIKVAKKNAKKLKTQVSFICSNLFQNLDKKSFDLIVCNPPYISSGEIETLDKSVIDYDPIIALDGGKFGLDFYKSILSNVDLYTNKNSIIIFEIGYNQGDDLKKLCKEYNLSCNVLKDYSNCDRIVTIKRSNND